MVIEAIGYDYYYIYQQLNLDSNLNQTVPILYCKEKASAVL